MIMVNALANILILFFIARVQQSDCYEDAPPAVDQRYGQNMCCYFAFAWSVDVTYMKSVLPNAQVYGKACFPKHKVVFAEGKTNLYATIVEDPNVDMEGIAYLLSIDDYAAILKEDSIRQSDGKRFGYAVTESVKVTLNGQETNINCNAFVSAGLPPKTPCKSEIEALSATFKDAGFTQKYIDAFCQTPSDQSC